MEKISGWPAHQIIGKNQHTILHHTRANGEAHPTDQCPVYKTFKDNQTRFVEDDIFWHKDGTSFPVEYSSTPLIDENNNTIGSVVIFRDISERKKAKEQAGKLRHELAHMARVSTMGEMASGMAHELNQPLTAISTNADACIRLIESSSLDKEKLSDILEIINLQAKRAGAIISQLRGFIRKDMPKKIPVSINDIIHEVLLLMQSKLNDYSIEVLLQMEPKIPSVLAQRIQIDQVIFNIVQNAIEAMSSISSQEHTLSIKTQVTDKNKVQVTIADSGKGIDNATLKQLFTPFSTTKKSGMGLGLSISKGIIEEHGGKIKYIGKTGDGAAFQFTLPLNQ